MAPRRPARSVSQRRRGQPGSEARPRSDLLAADADVIALEEITSAQISRSTRPHSPRRIRTRLLAGHGRAVVEVPGRAGRSRRRGLRLDAGRSGPRSARRKARSPSTSRISPPPGRRGGFTSGQRNDTIKPLGRQIAAEKLAGVVVMGDFNGTANDRSLAPLDRRPPLRPGRGRPRLRIHLARQVPDGPHRPHHGRGVTPTKAWVMKPHRQRPLARDRRATDLTRSLCDTRSEPPPRGAGHRSWRTCC